MNSRTKRLLGASPRKQVAVMLVGTACALLWQVGTAQGTGTTYYIDESTDYTGNPGCANLKDLNTVTYALEHVLFANSWTGSRYVNPDAWPQDFRDSCKSNGLDSSWADANSLSVFAGHGASDKIRFGHSHLSTCESTFTGDMRLGMMSSKKSAYAVWLSCDALQLPSYSTYNWVRQDFGWQNSIAIADNAPSSWFNLTAISTNADSWMYYMSGGGRLPAVISHSNVSIANCWAFHDDAALRQTGHQYLTPRPWGGSGCSEAYPLNYYCVEY